MQNLVAERGKDALKRLCGIAFTDSVHGMYGVQDSKQVAHFFQKRTRNWVTSNKSLDEPIRKRDGDCLCVSAGNVMLIFSITHNITND
jgi:hypothetical protein